ncbi:MAG TPA: cation:proton antiporter [Thermoleophilaceae bacterium]|nr:cation:proton antiporter [Thermoleophilaceae bacterium]
MLEVDAASFLVIVAVASLAGLTAALLEKRLAVPVVVIELLLGIVVGPDVLGIALPDSFTDFFANLGLGMLFFFAGYEIDFRRIAGRPLRLAVLGWLLSLALAYTVGGLLALAGVVLSLLYTGSALATTAIGTLIPVLRDAGELPTRFGTFLLAAGAIGEFGPILLVTLVLAGAQPAHEAAILVAFVAIAVVVAVIAVRSTFLGWPLMERTLEASSQVAVRLSVLLIFGLVALAYELGLDLLLGGFVAGLITRMALRGRELQLFESKLTAIGYGFFIPFFFIVSGLKFDLDALLSTTKTLYELPLFLGLFLLVRGAPALLLYRGVLRARRDRLALAFYSATELPLVVAITTIAVDGGHMRGSTAASLVGAAVLSTFAFPLVALLLRNGRTGAGPEPRLQPA